MNNQNPRCCNVPTVDHFYGRKEDQTRCTKCQKIHTIVNPLPKYKSRAQKRQERMIERGGNDTYED